MLLLYIFWRWRSSSNCNTSRHLAAHHFRPPALGTWWHFCRGLRRWPLRVVMGKASHGNGSNLALGPPKTGWFPWFHREGMGQNLTNYRVSKAKPPKVNHHKLHITNEQCLWTLPFWCTVAGFLALTTSRSGNFQTSWILGKNH